MNPYSIIRNKQIGKEHPPEEIEYLVQKYTTGDIPDYQMSAWLMAVYFQGMTQQETISYTKSLKNSGENLDFSHLPGYVLDKHSTGGVGDKVSLILGPILAACGCFVPMLSGRGLGHTGGTIDKLESIPGYKSDLPLKEFQRIVEETGLSIMCQTEEICPADGKIYALRDVTATVESIPLICGSILSKKLAEGIQGLVMDIKWGNGAFMENIDDARILGDLIKSVGNKFDIEVQICFTSMHQPLGNACGLWCEIQECILALRGNGPNDLMEVVNHLGKHALTLANITNPVEKISEVISNGKALEIFTKMIEQHSGKSESLFTNSTHLPKIEKLILADRDGIISQIDTRQIGMALVELGAGRKKQGDSLDNSAGIVFEHKTGSKLNSGDVIARVFCSDTRKLEVGTAMVKKAIQITDESADLLPLIQEGEN